MNNIIKKHRLYINNKVIIIIRILLIISILFYYAYDSMNADYLTDDYGYCLTGMEEFKAKLGDTVLYPSAEMCEPFVICITYDDAYDKTKLDKLTKENMRSYYMIMSNASFNIVISCYFNNDGHSLYYYNDYVEKSSINCYNQEYTVFYQHPNSTLYEYYCSFIYNNDTYIINCSKSFTYYPTPEHPHLLDESEIEFILHYYLSDLRRDI